MVDWHQFAADVVGGVDVNLAFADRLEALAASIGEQPFECAALVTAALGDEPNGPALIIRNARSLDRLAEAFRKLRLAIVSHPASRVRAEA
jgi:hypothetical protein